MFCKAVEYGHVMLGLMFNFRSGTRGLIWILVDIEEVMGERNVRLRCQHSKVDTTI